MTSYPSRLLPCLGRLTNSARAVVLVSLALFYVGGVRAETWTKYRTPYFVMLSAADEKTALSWAVEMQLYFEDLAKYAKQDLQRPPLTVVLFANDAEIMPFKPDNKPAGGEHPAYFGTTKSAAFFLLTPKSDRESTRAAAYHRALHWMTGGDSRVDIPAWYLEGLAEVMATYTLSRGEVQIGAPIPGHYRFLSPNALLSVRELFNVTHEGAMAGEYQRDTVFFAESWLLMHYVLIDQPALSSAPGKYMTLLEQKVAPAAAFQQAFGMNYAEMDKRLAEFSRRNSVKTVRRKVDVAAANHAIERLPFDPIDLELATGQAYLGMGHLSQADLHLQRALAARPHDVATLLSLADLATAQNDIESARKYCDQVIAAQPDNATAYYLRGRAVINAGSTGSVLEVAPVEARTACDDLIHAGQLAPQWTDVIQMVVGMISVAQPRRDGDYAFLQKAASSWPPSDIALAALGSLDDQAGNTAKARQEYEQVLQMDPPPSEHIRQYVKNRLDELNRASKGPDVQAELNALLEKKDYAKLNARLDELSANASAAEKITYDIYRGRAAAGQTIDQAQEAMDSGDKDKAESLLNDLLGQPHLDMDSKMRAREMLTTIKLQPTLNLKGTSDSSQ